MSPWMWLHGVLHQENAGVLAPWACAHVWAAYLPRLLLTIHSKRRSLGAVEEMLKSPPCTHSRQPGVTHISGWRSRAAEGYV